MIENQWLVNKKNKEMHIMVILQLHILKVIKKALSVVNCPISLKIQ
jgi:hypothetical protein